MRHKMILLGLDGVSFNIIDPWIEAGFLPTFSRIKREGAFGFLRSTLPSSTVPGWAAMLTGKNPGRLGYSGFCERISGSYNLGTPDLNWDTIKPVWHIVSNQYGGTVCVINVPTTSAAEINLNGTFIAGHGPLPWTAGRRWAVPDKIRKRLMEMSYKDLVAIPFRLSRPELISRHINVAKLQCDLALELFTQDSWDLFIFSIFVTDLANHLCLRQKKPGYQNSDVTREDLLELYQVVDSWLLAILNSMPIDCNIIIASDHGMTEGRWVIDLNQWLMEMDLLKAKPNREFWINRKKVQSLLERTRLILLYRRFTSNGLLRSAERIFKKHIPMENHGKDMTDWSGTEAYSINEQGIFVNLSGREPEGIVGINEYEDVRQRLIDELKTLKDPETGEEIVKGVWRREEIYSGPYLEKMPDIVIEWCWGYDNRITDGNPTGSIFRHPDPDHPYGSGLHTRDGIFMAYGPNIRKGTDIGSAQIEDIAPTILSLLGLKINDEIDGRVLTGAIHSLPGLRETEKVEIFKEDASVAQRDSSEDAEMIKERLKELGYM